MSGDTEFKLLRSVLKGCIRVFVAREVIPDTNDTRPCQLDEPPPPAAM